MNKNGWPFDEFTVLFTVMDHKRFDLSKINVEYSSKGVCHVIDNLKPQTMEGSGNGLKIGLNIIQSTYSEFEYSENDIVGTNAGVKIFLGESDEVYLQCRYKGITFDCFPILPNQLQRFFVNFSS